MEKISIIVPVYNSERTLKACIESLINQTYQYLDIILIDDGSTDKSSIICDKFAGKDSRIRVVHKKMEEWFPQEILGYLCFLKRDLRLFVTRMILWKRIRLKNYISVPYLLKRIWYVEIYRDF